VIVHVYISGKYGCVACLFFFACLVITSLNMCVAPRRSSANNMTTCLSFLFVCVYDFIS
jgi:hypothetical protein